MRDSWDVYFLKIAGMVATRSTCDRKHCGAVIVRDRSILSTGYNGSARGLPHCDDVGHMMRDGHCVRTVHAEANAIAQAAKNGVSIDGADMYINANPCWQCFKLIVNAGIKSIYFDDEYRLDDDVVQAAKDLDIQLMQISTTTTGEQKTLHKLEK